MENQNEDFYKVDLTKEYLQYLRDAISILIDMQFDLDHGIHLPIHNAPDLRKHTAGALENLTLAIKILQNTKGET